ncbi:MAG: hypothetical protein M3R35_01150, partial [Candidatus Eremiobacteraeota bacterium]|nr:hypothetical protein [Candidatus Eremiobacteraeota bacterium]
MHRSFVRHRAALAIACMLAFASGFVPAQASSDPDFTDVQSQRALALLNGQSCEAQLAQVTPPSPVPDTPSPSAAPSTAPTLPPAPSGPQHLYATPFPSASPSGPPPVPTPTPAANATNGPVFLQRSTATPSVAPAGTATAQPSATPTNAPTLPPGYIAVLADHASANLKP